MAPTTRRKISIAVPAKREFSDVSAAVSDEEDVVDVTHSRASAGASAKSRKAKSEQPDEEENDIDDLGEGEEDDDDDDEEEDDNEEEQEQEDPTDPDHASKKRGTKRGKYKKRSPSASRVLSQRSSAGGGVTTVMRATDPESVLRECNRVMDVILSGQAPDGHYFAAEFMELPSKKDFPDYYETVKRPICLSQMQHRLSIGGYRMVKDFKDDVARCVFNAKKYNLPRSPIYMDALMVASMCRRAIRGKPPVRMHSSRAHGPDQPTEPLASTAAGRKTQMNLELNIRFGSILSITDDGRKRCEIFMQLPDEEEYPSYYIAIAKPVCFAQILKKLKKSEVVNMQEAVDFVQLIFNNAKQFNEEESEVYLDAVFLQEKFDKMFANFPVDLRDPEVEPAPVPMATSHPPRIIVKLNSSTPGSAQNSMQGSFVSYNDAQQASALPLQPTFNNSVNPHFTPYSPNLYGGYRAPMPGTYGPNATSQPFGMNSPAGMNTPGSSSTFTPSTPLNGMNGSQFRLQNMAVSNRAVNQPPINSIPKPSQFEFPPSVRFIQIQSSPSRNLKTLFNNTLVRNHSIRLSSDVSSIRVLPNLKSDLIHSKELVEKSGELTLYNGTSLILRVGQRTEKMDIDDETKTPPPELEQDTQQEQSATVEAADSPDDLLEWDVTIPKGETRLEVKWQLRDTKQLKESYKIFIVKL